MNYLKQQDDESHPLGMVLERWAAHTDLSVVIANAGGFVVWVNSAFTRMCGYNSDELLGRRPGHILSGSLSGKRPREVLNDAIERQVPVRTRMVNYTKSGKPYWVEIHLEPIHNINGHLTGFISVERDVTAEELHQHEIGELSAAMYESLVREVGPNRSRNIRANPSKNGRQPDLKSSIAKRNRAKKVSKKGL
ncbi:MAG: PAS domain-containing protein [Verrucomicrobiota bacterium]|jgi:PAS domain S-box-containing protein